MTARHPWILTGPWYRWPSPWGPASGRDTPPALQAFAAPTFVDEFLREPQRSLVERPDDFFHGVRKLFLACHRRFYVIACELHCDAPGLPPVGREQVCEAGFVIRQARTSHGWVPDPGRPGIGTWRRVEQRPDTRTDEQTYPLFPLVPPPGAVGHSARGRSLYFGAVPTGSADTWADGNPRFDSAQLEIHCFVRRHRAGCPRRSSAPDCHGELTWSRPSAPFLLAAPFDPAGLRRDLAMARGALRLARLSPSLRADLAPLPAGQPLDKDTIASITAALDDGKLLAEPTYYEPRTLPA